MIGPRFIVSELIRKKRDGESFSEAELTFLVRGFSDDSIPDYQVSAWLMACYLKGLTKPETVYLTRAVRESGRVFEWRKLSSAFKRARFADKHSTGGVGDKVSLVLAPVAVALGLKVPMMSGRSLGHTGGTVDKLESIPGFTMSPTQAEMVDWLERTGLCMTAQTKDLCPADRKLYHLRDVTGTIESVPLITASIVSKKWAEGVDAIVFDVKCGEAAFMRDIAAARTLGRSLVDTATGVGMRALACITRMDEPLGSMIGNALEIKETLWMLSGEYPSETHRRLVQPLFDLSLALAAEMAVLAGTKADLATALRDAHTAIETRVAMRIFFEMAANQGAVEGWTYKLPEAKQKVALRAPRAGTVTRIFSRELGLTGIRMGAGRGTKDGRLDHSVGIEMAVAPGDRVTVDQPLLYFHFNEGSVADFYDLSAWEKVFELDGDQTIDPHHLMLEKVSG